MYIHRRRQRKPLWPIIISVLSIMLVLAGLMKVVYMNTGPRRVAFNTEVMFDQVCDVPTVCGVRDEGIFCWSSNDRDLNDVKVNMFPNDKSPTWDEVKRLCNELKALSI